MMIRMLHLMVFTSVLGLSVATTAAAPFAVDANIVNTPENSVPVTVLNAPENSVPVTVLDRGPVTRIGDLVEIDLNGVIPFTDTPVFDSSGPARLVEAVTFEVSAFPGDRCRAHVRLESVEGFGVDVAELLVIESDPERFKQVVLRFPRPILVDPSSTEAGTLANFIVRLDPSRSDNPVNRGCFVDATFFASPAEGTAESAAGLRLQAAPQQAVDASPHP